MAGIPVVKTPAITPVTIFYTNCNDLRNKIPELQVVSQTYQNCKIMCITETMFTSDILDAEVNIPNFNIYRVDRGSGKGGGGSCIYIHNCIQANILDDFNVNDSIALIVNTKPAPFVLVCIYRSQSLTMDENINMIEQIKNI